MISDKILLRWPNEASLKRRIPAPTSKCAAIGWTAAATAAIATAKVKSVTAAIASAQALALAQTAAQTQTTKLDNRAKRRKPPSQKLNPKSRPRRRGRAHVRTGAVRRPSRQKQNRSRKRSLRPNVFLEMPAQSRLQRKEKHARQLLLAEAAHGQTAAQTVQTAAAQEIELPTKKIREAKSRNQIPIRVDVVANINSFTFYVCMFDFNFFRA